MAADNPNATKPAPLINPLECKGCNRCAAACPKGLLKLSDKLNLRGYRYIEYKGEGCVGCCACFYTCPEPHALSVRLPPKRKSA